MISPKNARRSSNRNKWNSILHYSVTRPTLANKKKPSRRKKTFRPNDILELDNHKREIVFASFLTVWFLQITLKYILRVAPDAILPMCLAHRAQSFNSQIWEEKSSFRQRNDNNKIAFFANDLSLKRDQENWEELDIARMTRCQ